MKIAFSTLACPDFSWTDIYSMAKDLGFNGIEVRGLGEEIFAVKAKPFTEGEVGKTKEKLKSLKLEIPCLSSGCCLKDKAAFNENIAEITQYIALAESLGTDYIRVLGDLEPMPLGEVDDGVVAEALNALKGAAARAKVTLVVETNGVYADTKRLRGVLDAVNSSGVQALWDINHPCRFAGETPAQTVENLGGYIKFTHIKDSAVNESGKIEYRLMGEGDL
ncbi:MAG: sugar phosphate isomerase/epimerase, partial [Oscillospiraceae bacterium]|nr:sugar phosphate isomerase/epimerase [Oscillospiraceae bacterium]